MLFTIHVLAPFPQLGLHPGNLVMVEPGGRYPVNLLRPLPCNYGALVGLLEDGVGELVTPQTSVASFSAAVGWRPGNGRVRSPLAVSLSRSGRRGLVRLK